MPNYRRNYVPGGTYFFTVNLADRQSDLLLQEISSLRAAVAQTRIRFPFEIDAWVVLPDHIHAIWTLPPNDHDYSNRRAAIKRVFALAIPQTEPTTASRHHQGERNIWQRRFWEHTIRDDQDLNTHIDYIHFNPVKHALVSRVQDWPHSTFHRAVARGRYPINWAGGNDIDRDTGERSGRNEPQGWD